MSNFTTNPFGSPGFKDITKQCTLSWKTAPTSITAGTFPDIILDKNHSTKLEFYSTHSGAGVQTEIGIRTPKASNIIVLADIGVGAQIGGYSSAGRSVYSDLSIFGNRSPNSWNSWMKTASSGVFSQRLRHYNSIPNNYGNYGRIMFHSDSAGSFAWEIFSITILEICGI